MKTILCVFGVCIFMLSAFSGCFNPKKTSQVDPIDSITAKYIGFSSTDIASIMPEDFAKYTDSIPEVSCNKVPETVEEMLEYDSPYNYTLRFYDKDTLALIASRVANLELDCQGDNQIGTRAMFLLYQKNKIDTLYSGYPSVQLRYNNCLVQPDSVLWEILWDMIKSRDADWKYYQTHYFDDCLSE